MSGKSAYRFLGTSLLAGGVILSPFSYFILKSTPLVALGVSSLMLGITCLALQRAVPSVSSEASFAFLQIAMENTAALIEELGLSTKAIYLPASRRDGTAQAIIPLLPNTKLKFDRKLPGRLIVCYGPNPDDIGIAVSTLGSASLKNLETKPGTNAIEIEDALSRILVGSLDLATSVRVIVGEKKVEIEISGPKSHYDNIWFYRCLGSPLASIVATITAEALDKAVMIKSEALKKNKSHIEIEILN